MKHSVLLGSLAAVSLLGGLAGTAQADPPRHDHGRSSGYARERYRSNYDHNGQHDRYDRGYGDRDSYGRYGGRSDGYSYRSNARGGYRDYNRGDAYRHDDHPAERKKFTHGGRHVIDRKHGHHR